MSALKEAVAVAQAKFDQAQRAADAAYAASDHGREAAETWRSAVRSAQETVRAERMAVAESQERARGQQQSLRSGGFPSVSPAHPSKLNRGRRPPGRPAAKVGGWTGW